LAAFWSEEFVSLVDEIGFEELILNMKISMLNCQTKKMTDVPFQGFVHVAPKHRPPATYGKGKKFTVRIECSLHTHKNQSKMLSLQQVLWNMMEHDMSE